MSVIPAFYLELQICHELCLLWFIMILMHLALINQSVLLVDSIAGTQADSSFIWTCDELYISDPVNLLRGTALQITHIITFQFSRWVLPPVYTTHRCAISGFRSETKISIIIYISLKNVRKIVVRCNMSKHNHVNQYLN